MTPTDPRRDDPLATARVCSYCHHILADDDPGHFIPPSFGDPGFPACKQLCPECKAPMAELDLDAMDARLDQYAAHGVLTGQDRQELTGLFEELRAARRLRRRIGKSGVEGIAWLQPFLADYDQARSIP